VSMPATASNRLCVSSSRSVAAWTVCPVGRPYTASNRGLFASPAEVFLFFERRTQQLYSGQFGLGIKKGVQEAHALCFVSSVS
jgi:hypothetical protein